MMLLYTIQRSKYLLSRDFWLLTIYLVVLFALAYTMFSQSIFQSLKSSVLTLAIVIAAYPVCVSISYLAKGKQFARKEGKLPTGDSGRRRAQNPYIFNVPIESIALDSDTSRCLKEKGLILAGDVVSRDKKELENIGLDRRTIDYIDEFFSELGYSLGKESYVQRKRKG